MSVRRSLVVVATAVLLAACSSSHNAVIPRPSTTTATTSQITTQAQADSACRHAAAHFVNAQPTTVGAIHAITGGTSVAQHPYGWILKGSAPRDTAAWCWYQPTPQHYKLLVVAADGKIVDSGQGEVGKGARPRPGPLAVT